MNKYTVDYNHLEGKIAKKLLFLFSLILRKNILHYLLITINSIIGLVVNVNNEFLGVFLHIFSDTFEVLYSNCPAKFWYLEKEIKRFCKLILNTSFVHIYKFENLKD